jgi:dGTPase
MYQPNDFVRLDPTATAGVDPEEHQFRSKFYIDYARLIHSPGFRRLQGKTQLYPAKENDFFRTRLTHSIEVAQIAKSIANKLNFKFDLNIDTDLVQFSSLAHDIGHPPFGHQGEEALDNLMMKYGGFEGNAQTLRLLVRLEKKYKDFGLNLTSRTIASVLKYDQVIPATLANRKKYAAKKRTQLEPVKGYYETETEIVDKIKKNVLGRTKISAGTFKTIECQIMDVADDIAYSTYDLEDTLKAGFSNPFDIIFPKASIVKKIAAKISKKSEITISEEQISEVLLNVFKDYFPDILPATQDQIKGSFILGANIFYNTLKALATDGYIRNQFTSNLIDKFIAGVEFTKKRKVALSLVYLNEETRLTVEVLKHFNYEINILSPRLRIVAYRGKEIVEKIFHTLTEEENGYLLMPDDFRNSYLQALTKKEKLRVVCDFIAGMTDAYCIEYYARLTSENAETIFKPY